MTGEKRPRVSLWELPPERVHIAGHGGEQTLLTIVDRLRSVGHCEGAIQWAIHEQIQSGDLRIVRVDEGQE